MAQSGTPATSELPVVLVDTNIFGNLLDPKTFEQTYNIIIDLSKKYRLSISNITIQEIVSKGTKDISSILKLFRAFKKFEVDNDVLVFAGLMTCVNIKGNFDSIIASTAFLNNAGILTANQRDFPEPCFTEIDIWSISCKDDGNRTIHHLIHLLSSNVEKTAKKFVEEVEYVREAMKSTSKSGK